MFVPLLLFQPYGHYPLFGSGSAGLGQRMEEREERPWMMYVALFLGAALFIALAYFVWTSLMTKKGPHRKPALQQIALVKPPPPKPEEKPPEPEVKKDELKIPEPEQQPKEAEAPAPGPDLAVDSDGGAGSDSFGLVGKKGGADLINSGAQIGSGGGRAQFAYYTGQIQDHLQQALYAALSRDAKLRRSTHRAVVKIWLGPDGRISKFELVNSTGDTEADGMLKSALAAAPPLPEPPPQTMPQPVTLRLKAGAAG